MLAKQAQYQANHLSSLIFLLTKLTMVEMQLSLLPSRHEAPGFYPRHCKTKERKGEKEEKRAKKKKELTAYSHINNILVVFLQFYFLKNLKRIVCCLF